MVAGWSLLAVMHTDAKAGGVHQCFFFFGSNEALYFTEKVHQCFYAVLWCILAIVVSVSQDGVCDN
jgi:hypothetical protein